MTCLSTYRGLPVALLRPQLPRLSVKGGRNFLGYPAPEDKARRERLDYQKL
jgi:hypothetical protein